MTTDSGNQGSPAPPGWYQTEQGQRYWDGIQWTTLAPPTGPAGSTSHDAPTYQLPQVAPHPSGISSEDRLLALLAHLLGIPAAGLGPLVIFMVKKDDSAFVRHHAAEALNLFITYFIVSIAAFIAFFGVFVAGLFSSSGGLAPAGTLLLVVMSLGIAAASVGQLVLLIVAGLAANRGEWYRIPFCVHLVK